MTKYILYCNIENMTSRQAIVYSEDMKKVITEDLLEPGDKLVVLGVREGYTRLETIPE